MSEYGRRNMGASLVVFWLDAIRLLALLRKDGG
jgi:hypothetical protein